jgi:hypothetical protein
MLQVIEFILKVVIDWLIEYLPLPDQAQIYGTQIL